MWCPFDPPPIPLGRSRVTIVKLIIKSFTDIKSGKSDNTSGQLEALPNNVPMNFAEQVKSKYTLSPFQYILKHLRGPCHESDFAKPR